MTHRHPKLPLALRIIAAGCVVLWLAGVSACNLEALFCCPSHGSATAAHADHDHSQDAQDAVAGTDHEHDVDAHQSEDAEGHSHGSPKHNSKEGSCCSTLKGVVLSANPVVFGKPALHSKPCFGVPLETHPASLALFENPQTRQAKPCDWVFTHGVCTAPANRAHAPPFSRLS